MKSTTHRTIRHSDEDNASVYVMAYVSQLPEKPDCVNVGINKGGFHLNEEFTPAEARKFADALIKAAGEVEVWQAEPAGEVSQ